MIVGGVWFWDWGIQGRLHVDPCKASGGGASKTAREEASAGAGGLLLLLSLGAFGKMAAWVSSLQLGLCFNFLNSLIRASSIVDTKRLWPGHAGSLYPMMQSVRQFTTTAGSNAAPCFWNSLDG